MKRPVVAALLCLLVLPGAGQLYLGRRRRALVFLLPAIASLAVLLDHALAQAFAIGRDLGSGAIAPDPAAIMARLETAGAAVPPAVEIAAAVALLCWLASTLDAYRLGRQD